jgi:hypothetical protein
LGTRWSRGRKEPEERNPVRFGAAEEAGLNTEEWDLLRAAPDYDAEEMATVWPGDTGMPRVALSTESASDEDLSVDLSPQETDEFSAAAPGMSAPSGSSVEAEMQPAAGWQTAPAPPPVTMESVPSESGSRGPEAVVPPWAPPNRVETPAPRPEERWQASTPSIYSSSAYSSLGTPGRGPQPAKGTHTGMEGRPRFPEERTLALLAEDLLGRPLNEPAVAAAPSAVLPSSGDHRHEPSTGSPSDPSRAAGLQVQQHADQPGAPSGEGASGGPPRDYQGGPSRTPEPSVARPAAGSSDMWDQAMPTTREAGGCTDSTGLRREAGRDSAGSMGTSDGSPQLPTAGEDTGGWAAEPGCPQSERMDVLTEALIAGERAGLLKAP